jgi:hypothetical protein
MSLSNSLALIITLLKRGYSIPNLFEKQYRAQPKILGGEIGQIKLLEILLIHTFKRLL